MKAIHAQEIIDILVERMEGVRCSQFVELVMKRFGQVVTFYTSSRQGMDLDALLNFLENRGQIRIERGVIYVMKQEEG